MQTKKIVAALVIILVAVGGFVAGLILLQQDQDFEQKAAVPGGQATVSVEPATGNFDVDQTISPKIYFDTANISISGIAIRLSYPYSGSTPEVSVSGIDINQTLLSSGDWTCPTKNSSLQGGNVVIDIACANVSASGYATSGKTLLADINLKVNRTPQSNPLTLRFDPSLSIITQKSNNQDILLIPASTGSYTIAGGNVATLTPTPTSKVSGTPTPTSKVTATLTPTTKLSPTPTSSVSKGGVEELPDAGVSMPTILGVGMGVFAVIGAILLAL